MKRQRFREAGLSTRRKRTLWDRRYLSGYPHWQAPLDAVEHLREGLGETGSLLDLACGAGGLLKALRDVNWRGTYCGVDISSVAIKHARRLQDSDATWAVSPIEQFRTNSLWTAISLIECVYYINPLRLRSTLQSFLSMIQSDGFLLIRIHDADKHAVCASIIESFPRARRVNAKLYEMRPTLARS